MGVVKAPVCNRWRGGTRAQATPAARGGLFQTLKRGASAGAMGADRQAHAGRSPGLPSFGPAQPARSYCAFMSTGLKSSLPWKYTTMMQSPPSSHLSSWTCLAGCDHTDPIQGALPMSVSVANYCADRRSIAYQKKSERSRTKAPIQSSTIGINGLTFKTSCDSSVAIAPAK